MAMIRIACPNLLEVATAFDDVGTALADYPLSRLIDRNTVREYKITEDVAREWQASGGISALAANALMVAAGHSLAGLAYTVQHSANGSAWTTISSGTIPAGTGVVCIEFAATAAAYWKFTIAPSGQDVTMTELLLTDIYTFTRAPARPSGALEKQYNVEIEETSAGSERFIEYGPERRRRAYQLPNIPVAMSDEITGRIGALGGKKPFFLCDHTGAWIWCRLEEDLVPREIAYGRHELDLNIIEVI